MKVGKAKPKASNFTDTSFRSKCKLTVLAVRRRGNYSYDYTQAVSLTSIAAIVLNQQSLTTTAPSSVSRFTHYLSLLNAKSDTQRRDALSYLTTAIASRPVDSPLPQPVSVLLPSMLPLILDGNAGVRTQLLKLFKVLPAGDMEGHVSTLLPYVRAGMTHLAADIRLSAIEIMAWLLSIGGHELVSSQGGWIKTLNCFLTMLGWHTEESAKWSSNRASFGKSGTDGRPMIKVLQTFGDFLRVGIVESEDSEPSEADKAEYSDSYDFPIRDMSYYVIPTKSAPYSHLNLFGQPKDEEGEMYEAQEDRMRVFVQRFSEPVERGLVAAKRDGGESGRAAAVVQKVLKEASVQADDKP